MDFLAALRLPRTALSTIVAAEFLAGDADATLIGGNFNNSVVWDYPEKKVKFGDFMDDLESTGFASAYHLDRKYERGAEPDPTLW